MEAISLRARDPREHRPDRHGGFLDGVVEGRRQSVTATRPWFVHGHRWGDGRPHAVQALASLTSLNAGDSESAATRSRPDSDHRWLTVTVDDAPTGIRFALERRTVFKPFLRLDVARNNDDSGAGTGLGLRSPPTSPLPPAGT